jgi:cystathionine gamma-synthase
MKQHERNARRIAEWLSADGRTADVLYPGLDAHPGHAIAARQMQGGFGGMLSMRIRGGEAAAIASAGNMKVWKRATSLGGVESLVEHRSSIEGAGSPCPSDLLRFSVGLENVEDLIADIELSLLAP